MTPKELAEKIFSVDKSIRYVGVLGGPKNELLESHMRDGVTSLTQEKDDQWFVEIMSPVILGAAEKLEKDLGRITYSLIRYKNVTLVTLKIQEYVIILSVEPGVIVKHLYERIKALT